MVISYSLRGCRIHHNRPTKVFIVSGISTPTNLRFHWKMYLCHCLLHKPLQYAYTVIPAATRPCACITLFGDVKMIISTNYTRSPCFERFIERCFIHFMLPYAQLIVDNSNTDHAGYFTMPMPTCAIENFALLPLKQSDAITGACYINREIV